MSVMYLFGLLNHTEDSQMNSFSILVKFPHNLLVLYTTQSSLELAGYNKCD